MEEVFNINTVDELIRNLATLTVPQLLKWMIVNIHINELNNCLRRLGVVDILPPTPGGGSPYRTADNDIV